MQQFKNYADDRLVRGCVYCGGPEETRDHTPSRVFLDSPYPEQLPVVGACLKCNNGFSKDEEYIACLIEAAVASSTDPDRIRRPNIAKILRKSPALRTKLEQAKFSQDEQVHFNIESERLKNVLLKLARGHAAFELSQILRRDPSSVWWKSLSLMTDSERNDFDAIHVVGLFGEVGSRGMQRLLVVEAHLQAPEGEKKVMQLVVNDWVDVQDDRYRYLAIDDHDGVTIRIVIAECLACEIKWHA